MIKKVYTFFLITSVILLGISITVKALSEEAIFDVTIFGLTIRNSYSFLWLMFSLYSFLLGGIYMAAAHAKLKFRKWILIIHCVAVALFFVFFAAINIFSTPGFRGFLEPYDLSLLTILGIYIVLMMADVLLFLIGFLLLFINLLFSSKKGPLKKHSKTN